MERAVGVLALQGAFRAHADRLRALGASVREVRTPIELRMVDALVMPGGESTTMSNLLASSQLYDPIAERIDAGMPVFATCAGMILLADTILEGRADQRHFGALDITVRRNGFGRQIASFETDLDVAGLDAPFHGVFIRAPRIEAVGDDVEVLARHGAILAASFHPELTPDARLHGQFLELVDRHAADRPSSSTTSTSTTTTRGTSN